MSQPTCQAEGHIWNSQDVCMFCGTPMSNDLIVGLRSSIDMLNREGFPRTATLCGTAADEIERLRYDLNISRIESAHFANTQRATQASLEMQTLTVDRLQKAVTSAMKLLSDGDTEAGARVLRECFWGTDRATVS
jgi:hypothetical protein